LFSLCSRIRAAAGSPADIAIKQNLASSDWFDLGEAISADVIAVFINGEPDAEKELLSSLRNDSEKKAIGASLRWGLVVGDSNRLELMLQALPLPKTFVVSKPILRADSSPVISLGSVAIDYNSFDGELAAGPVPRIFCAEADQATITSNAESAHGQIQKLAGLFAKPELVGFREAEKLVKKPRVGAVDLSFKRKFKKGAAGDQQPAKRPRAEPIPETGR